MLPLRPLAPRRVDRRALIRTASRGFHARLSAKRRIAFRTLAPDLFPISDCARTRCERTGVRARARAFHLYLVSSENARGREGEACSRELSKCTYERCQDSRGAASAYYTFRGRVCGLQADRSLLRSGQRNPEKSNWLDTKRKPPSLCVSCEVAELRTPRISRGFLCATGDTERTNPRNSELSCLLAGGGAQHHRRQCFPHGVRGAASAPADPAGCNLAAIDAVLSQRQAGAPIVVGTSLFSPLLVERARSTDDRGTIGGMRGGRG